MIAGREELKRVVRGAARSVPAADGYTCLTPHALFEGGPGVDALLTTPALLQEAARYGHVCPPAASPREKADMVYKAIFLDRSPVSDAAQVALWSLKKLGLWVGERSLAGARRVWDRRRPEDRLLDALDMAGLCSVAVRVDIFHLPSTPLTDFDDRLSAALCLDALMDPGAAWPMLAARGCENASHARLLILRSAEKLRPQSLLISAPFSGPLWEEAVLPAAQALALPLVDASSLSTELPSAEALRARIAREGFSFTPYYSGADCVEALPGLWDMARRAVADALIEAYMPLVKSGWMPTAGEVAHDMEAFLRGKSSAGLHCS